MSEEVLVQLDSDTVGPFAVEWAKKMVPNDTGDEKFKFIAKDFGGKGTTCGFLPHALMYVLGCRDPKQVNRTEPGLKYIPGWNLRQIWNAGRAPFKRFSLGSKPEPGDIVYVSNGPPNTEHVFVFLGAVIENGVTYWLSADGGQRNTKNQECMRLAKRKQSGRLIGSRAIMGWLPLKSLKLTAPALVDVNFLAEGLSDFEIEAPFSVDEDAT